MVPGEFIQALLPRDLGGCPFSRISHDTDRFGAGSQFALPADILWLAIGARGFEPENIWVLDRQVLMNSHETLPG